MKKETGGGALEGMRSPHNTDGPRVIFSAAVPPASPLLFLA